MNKSRKTRKNLNHKNKTRKSRQNINKITVIKPTDIKNVIQLQTNLERKKYINSMIKAFMQSNTSKVTPNSDFYNYTNYSWVTNKERDNEISSKFYSQLDDPRIKQEEVYYQIMDIVKDLEHKNKEVANLRNSVLNRSEQEATRHISEATEKINEFVKKDDLYGLLAYTNMSELIKPNAPISWNVMPDLKHPEIVRNYINIPPANYGGLDQLITIFDTDDAATIKRKKEFKRKFFEYLQELFDIIYGKENHHLDPEAMLQVNYEILNSIKNHDVKEKVFYNVVTKKESIDKLGFDWSKFALALGYKKVPDFFISDSLSYVKSIMNIINAKWKTPAWISWWKYLFIKNISRFHKGISHIYFNFSRKYVQGISSHMPTEIGPIFIMSLGFDKAISEEYVKRYRSQKVIDYVNNIAENIRSIFIKKIKRNTWLTPKTKAAALMKLEHIKFVIGDSANGLHDDPDIKYSPIDPWGNLTKIYLSRLKKYIDMEGKSSALLNFPYIDLKNLRLSGRQIYIVNAFYTPAKNDIYIPLAYLQKPFVDLDERGIEYNLAYIGFTIGHELAHSLDNTGSKFDYTGKLVNWWNPQDLKIYNQKLDNIKKQYVLFAKRDGVILDPNLSIGENCADIIGVSLCEEYLQDFQLKNDDVVSIKYLSFKGYYNYVAIQMRQVISKKALKAQAGTNPHPPDKYRVNVPLSRLKIFKSIYNIKKTDKMYWHNHDVIW